MITTNHDEQARMLKLAMPGAAMNLNLIGRLFVDSKEKSLWERDTSVLPLGAARWRRRAAAFADTHIKPRSSSADAGPEGFDPGPLILRASREGFQTLMLPMPLGSADPTVFVRSTVIQLAVVAEEFAARCGGLALLLLAHHLGCAPLLLSGHVPTFLRHLLPLYIRTRFGTPEVMAFAITEPGAGSDVEETLGAASARLVTTARRASGGYVLNGRKCFISDGAIADKVTLYARLEKEGIESWTCFLLERGMHGFSVGRREHKMGQRAADASELVLEDVFIPDRNVVGKLRSGWANNRNVLNYSRPVVGAMALGHGRGALECALEFCRRTRLGPRRLIDYQDIQIALADMFMSLWSARAMVWHCCRSFRCFQSASAAAKVVASDTAFKVSSQAMEIMGDHGYLHENSAERLWRDSRLTQIYEGTNQINRLALVEQQWETDFRSLRTDETRKGKS
jgi:alkylation response protein AidB-like acyl-CoA dehydrogenase